MALILWLIAVVIAVIGLVQLLQGQILLGIILLIVLGAPGATAMFSALRSFAAPTYSGSPEVMFFVGVVLLLLCFFIWRHMVR